ncbi:endonuclease domain-containing protein [Aestuariimicrobium ganziense]|uniref:endonuclease domain-containing protein n=1 Tax=Aestuariimicrobium ganziense TaxID=2773677 RepID=UPI00194132DA|nr:DUF559 domain-containing protein [Aestuariimicrobium ganziense]
MTPGVARHHDQPETLDLRCAAVTARHPVAVVRGATAATLTWWPELAASQVQVSGVRTHSPRWLSADRSQAPTDLRQFHGDLAVAGAELSTLDMARHQGTRPIWEALRRQVTTIEQLRDAFDLLKPAAGHQALRQMLNQSRKGPWSPLELEAHDLLHTAGLDQWQANHPVWIVGELFFIDIAFPELKIAIELDGQGHHSSPADLARDDTRQNLLVLDGWLVLRYRTVALDTLVDNVLAAIQIRSTIG